MSIRAAVSLLSIAVILYILGVLTGASYKKRSLKYLENKLKSRENYWIRVTNDLREVIYEVSMMKEREK